MRKWYKVLAGGVVALATFLPAGVAAADSTDAPGSPSETAVLNGGGSTWVGSYLHAQGQDGSFHLTGGPNCQFVDLY